MELENILLQIGSIYSGSFVNGNRDGSGEIVYMDGTIIVGNFKEGNLVGEANITYQDGSKAKINY